MKHLQHTPSTAATLKVASRLRTLLRKRMWLSDADWFHAVGQLCEDIKHEKLVLQAGKVKQSTKSAPNPLIHGFGNSTRVVEFCAQHKLTLPHKEHWWTMDQGLRLGHIHALENSTGIPRITNGIDIWIERADGSLFKGHKDWWVWHRKPRVPKETSGTTTSASVANPKGATGRFVVHAKAILAKENGVDTFAEKYYAATGQRAELLLDTEAEAVASIAKALQTYMEMVTAII